MKNTTPTLTTVQTRAQELITRSLEVAQHLAEQIRTAAEDAANEVRDTVESALSTTAQQAREGAEPTAEQVSAAVDELIRWADANRERVVVDLTRARGALEDRLAARAVVTRADLDVIEARIAAVESTVSTALDAATRTPVRAAAKKPAAKKAATKKPAAKKTAAPRSATKKG